MSQPKPTKQHRGMFKPGQCGNPKGKPKGARNKLGSEWLTALHDDFVRNGPSVLRVMRMQHPSHYFRVLARLFPKTLYQMAVELDVRSELELDRRIAALVRELKIGTAAPAEGEGDDGRPHGAEPLPPLS
jgi:hypothetical protein